MEIKDTYRFFPLISIAFIRISISFTLELAIPLYFINESLNAFQIGIISSGTSMTYLFSPILLKDVPKKIGIKKSLLISVFGTLLIQIIFQFSLESWLVYGLLILEGMLLGLF